ncbi:hypothetical protein MMC25_002134 [Agyrium rufum]|nr:hypothetical protein [Agyrium rufum]
MIGHQRSPSPSQWVPASRSSGASLAASIARSGYSSSSQEVVFDYPGPQAFTFEAPPAGNQMNNIEQQKLITALREHRLNNILELCRIENVLMNSDGELLDLVEPLADAWSYYVGSHSLLNELRGLTRSFPFSSECLDEAKWLVDHDTQMGGGTQNYCLAVLMKIREESLVRKHAYIQTVAPEMWGGRSPSQSALNQLAERFIESWTDAVNRLLQYWEESRSRSR